MVTFRPAWDDHKIHSDKLATYLKKKVGVVPSYKGAPLFPVAFMTYGCARWAVRSVLSFSSAFTKETGLKNRFNLRDGTFRLP